MAPAMHDTTLVIQERGVWQGRHEVPQHLSMQSHVVAINIHVSRPDTQALAGICQPCQRREPRHRHPTLPDLDLNQPDGLISTADARGNWLLHVTDTKHV